MRIGELARRSGLSQHTIRFYTNLGLLRAVDPPWDAPNRYKDFPDENLDRIELIVLGQRLGMTLQQIASRIEDVLAARSSPEQVLRLLNSQLAQVTQQIERLRETQIYLQTKLAFYKGEANCPPSLLPLRPQIVAALDALRPTATSHLKMDASD